MSTQLDTIAANRMLAAEAQADFDGSTFGQTVAKAKNAAVEKFVRIRNNYREILLRADTPEDGDADLLHECMGYMLLSDEKIESDLATVRDVASAEAELETAQAELKSTPTQTDLRLQLAAEERRFDELIEQLPATVAVFAPQPFERLGGGEIDTIKRHLLTRLNPSKPIDALKLQLIHRRAQEDHARTLRARIAQWKTEADRLYGKIDMAAIEAFNPGKEKPEPHFLLANVDDADKGGV